MPSKSSHSVLNRIFASEVAIPLLSFVIVLPLIGLSAFIHPTDTDYSWTLDRRELGVWGSYVLGFETVTGRYIANLLAVLTPMPTDPAQQPLTSYTLILYRLAPVFGMLGLAYSIQFFFRTILERSGKGHIWVIALWLFTLYIGRLENHAELLYWYQGNIQYLLPIITLLLFLAYLVRLTDQPGAANFIAAIIWGALTIGGNETALVTVNVLMLAICANMWITAHALRSKFLSLFGILLCFSLLSFFAPANSARDAIVGFRMEKNFLFATYKSLLSSLKNGLYWMPLTIAVSLLLIEYIQRKGIRLKPVLRSINLPWAALVLSACYVLAYFPNAWARGEANPPMRIVDVAQFLFMMGFSLLMILMADKQTINAQGNWISSASPAGILLVIATICLFHADGRVRRSYSDLLTKARTYDKEMMDRYQVIRQSTTDEVALPPLSKVPETVFFRDILSNPDWWLNEQEARYFGRKKIYLTQPETSSKKMERTAPITSQ